MEKISVSDLSVGDWFQARMVKWYYKDLDITPPMRVAEISSDEVMLQLGSVKHYAFVDDLQPIPITPEILETNGWRNDGMYAILRIDEHLHLEYYYHEHRLRKWYCGIDEWVNHAKVNDITFQAHCYSVHQLQHALRLAGVDKEITL